MSDQLLFRDEQYKMREPCKNCGHEFGRIRTVNGQDTVRCAQCERHAYNAPKTETGRDVRSVTRNREPIKPGLRARILVRDNGHCLLCNSKENLHVGHLMSVELGRTHNVPADLIDDEDNLAAMCDQCNLGLGDNMVPPRLFFQFLRVWRLVRPRP